MKTMIAVRLAASAILVLGGAMLALAQPTTFNNLSAAVDWGQFDPAKVPDAVENLVTVIRPATKECPSTTGTAPTMTLYAEGRVPADWPQNVTFSETGFLCQMSGVQCGFGDEDEPITATSSEVRVYQAPPDDDDRRPKLRLTCSADVKSLQ